MEKTSFPTGLPAHYNNSLVQSQMASQFMQLASIEAGRAGLVGDPAKVHASVQPYVLTASVALRDGADKVRRLVDDPTRTTVAKHEAASKVAAQTIETLQKQKANIEREAANLWESGQDTANGTFTPRASHASLDSEIRTYVREQVKLPGGMVKIREILGNFDVASVIYHSPDFLLGLTTENKLALQQSIVQRHLPDAWEKMDAAVSLQKLFPRYDETIQKVRSYFFNSSIAEQAKRRVDI